MKIFKSGFLLSFLFGHFFLTSIILANDSATHVSMNHEQAKIVSLETDKSTYSPGEIVKFVLQVEAGNGADLIADIDYYHLTDKIRRESHTIDETGTGVWEWLPPNDDYTGYLVLIRIKDSVTTIDSASIAVDVSTDWSKFPRYGFISKFPAMDMSDIHTIISRLNRLHINGLQFYDWHHKHHKPLKGTAQNPALTWIDIANRVNHLNTIRNYINAAHEKNMQTMAYNLLFGSWEDAHLDGVSPNWRLFRDQNLESYAYLNLPSSWASDIYIMDTSNPQWRSYLINRMKEVFQALPFDGWHVDQLGDYGDLWNANGEKVIQKETYRNFLQEAKDSLNIKLVMNAVNQYGQDEIALSPVDFLYTEIWNPNEYYGDLVRLVNNNLSFSNNRLNTVFTAYMNYDLSDSPGIFNTPGVLYTDAVIFAAGGAHLEIGEHMLCHEYFPNDNLEMSGDLQLRIVHYYDFLVAYQNILRDNFANKIFSLASDYSVALKTWPLPGSIWYFSKEKQNTQVIHFLNFSSLTNLKWRDNIGTQPPPEKQKNIDIRFKDSQGRHISSVWVASPDTNNGAPINLDFTVTDEVISISIPSLEYWTMLVIVYESSSSSIKKVDNELNKSFSLFQNYPNPFNPTTVIPFTTIEEGMASFQVFNTLGKLVHEDSFLSQSGLNHIFFNGDKLSSGIYIYALELHNILKTGKMNLVQ